MEQRPLDEIKFILTISIPVDRHGRLAVRPQNEHATAIILQQGSRRDRNE